MNKQVRPISLIGQPLVLPVTLLVYPQSQAELIKHFLDQGSLIGISIKQLLKRLWVLDPDRQDIEWWDEFDDEEVGRPS